MLDKLVGLAIAQIALKPLKSIYGELGDRDDLHRLEVRETALRTGHVTADGHVRAQYEARGGHWEEDMRAARAQVETRIRAIQQEGGASERSA